MLAPYRVLDLTDARAELATFIMAGLGADVIKVEPPLGSDSRIDGDGAGAGLRFDAYNHGKRSVVLDLESDAGRASFLQLVATADFVVENAGPGAMEGRGLGFDVLRKARPDLVYVAISPFGHTGPYAGHLATDLTLSAMGGAMALNGDPDRRPVRITVPQTWHHAAAESVVGALTAHHVRLASGEAQFVDVSVQAAVFWTGLQAMTAHAIQGRNIERNGTVLQLIQSTPLVYPCADGEVCLILTGATLHAMLRWMLEAGTITAEWFAREDWSTYEVRVVTAEPLAISSEELRATGTAYLLTKTKAQLFARGISEGATLAPVNTVADVLSFEQLTHRDYWQERTLTGGRTVRMPGPFLKASATPIMWPRPAPLLGEHTNDVLGTVRVRDRTPAPPSADHTPSADRDPPARLPLEGVKVADFSWIGVGPITAKALADHGATVVHIETDKPVDRLRMTGPFKDNIPGMNRCQFFGAFNTSKLSLGLNMKTPQGHAIARRMLAWCDISLNSFTAGTMDRNGLGYAAAREVNPGIIVAETCLLGQTGPAARMSGYGYHAAAVSGFHEITGWDDRSPGGPFNAYTDTIAPRFLTATLMAALDHRRRTGEGQYIDQAQMESALHFLTPELLEVQLSGVSARRNGNWSPTAFPHDAYPCAGHDQWCAIAVETDGHWRSLKTAMGDPGWASSGDLDTLVGRRAAAAMIERELSEFTRLHEPRALMDLLQAAGVPAGMVQRSSDHQEDPQFGHRSFFRHLEHPEMGTVPYEGHQFRISGYDSGPRMPAPCLGEHTYEVLRDILAMSDEEIAETYAAGAVL
jgi:crotonobetainyl-CoA:carnitine CoA-transferase CaiB-like acyl-CoA transferase